MHGNPESMRAKGISAIPGVSDRPVPRRARLPTRAVAAISLVLVGIKLTFSLAVLPNEDEAYYFQWGQHLALSYFDHAPLQGWMQALGGALFGFTTLGLRVMNQVTLLGSGLIFWAWAGRLEPDDRVNLFWTVSAVYLASPLILGITTLAYPDHWLMFLCLASMHYFGLFLGERLGGRAGLYRHLYAGAALLGLAALAKYNAVTLGVALAGFIVVHPKLRSLLRDIHLYAAALVSVAMLSPVLAWNAANGFASLAFQLYGRYGPGGPGDWGAFSLERFLPFAVLTILYLGVALIPALVAFYARPAGTGFRGALVGLAKWTFAVSTLTISAISFFAKGAPHWNIVALIGFVPLAALFIRWRWLLWLHLLLGVVAMGVASVYFASYPTFSSEILGDREAASYYGYDQVARRMTELRDEHDAAGLASIFYGGASKLAFGAGPGVFVTSLAPVHDAYDDWRDEAALADRDLIIHDEWGAIGLVTDQFQSVIHLEDITVTRFGVPIMRYSLHLGRGYKGLPAP
jgi:hypothetical protein